MPISLAKAAHFARCWFGAQYRHAPLFLRLIPTDRCPLRCAYCYQHREDSPDMPAETAWAVLDHARRLGTGVLSFLGGEPLVWPHLDDALARASRHCFLTDITTNGQLLTPERLDGLTRAGLDYLNISVDALTPQAVTRKCRLADGEFLEALGTARAKGLRVRINSVLYNDNRGEVIEILDLCRRERLPISIGYVVPQRGAGDQSFHLSHMAPEDRQGWRDLLERRRREGDRIIDPPAYLAGIERFLRHENFWSCNYPRRFGWINVSPNGRLRSCTKHMNNDGPVFTELTSAGLADFRAGLRPKVAQCVGDCYSNCAFDGSYFRRHPVQFFRTFLAA